MATSGQPNGNQMEPEVSLGKDSIVKDSIGESEGADKPPTRSRFVPPTVEEVRAYCLERGSKVDPEVFVSFYASKGWMIGKNKMRDWQAAVVTWEKKQKEEHHDRHNGTSGAGSGRWNITPDVYDGPDEGAHTWHGYDVTPDNLK